MKFHQSYMALPPGQQMQPNLHAGNAFNDAWAADLQTRAQMQAIHQQPMSSWSSEFIPTLREGGPAVAVSTTASPPPDCAYYPLRPRPSLIAHKTSDIKWAADIRA